MKSRLQAQKLNLAKSHNGQRPMSGLSSALFMLFSAKSNMYKVKERKHMLRIFRDREIVISNIVIEFSSGDRCLF